MKIQKPGIASGVETTLIVLLVGVIDRGEGRIWEKNVPAEQKQQSKNQVGNITTRLSILNTSDNHVRERRRKPQECKQEEEHKSTALMHGVSRFRIPVQTNRIIPAEEHEDRD